VYEVDEKDVFGTFGPRDDDNEFRDSMVEVPEKEKEY
jgi:hypothetical protein